MRMDRLGAEACDHDAWSKAVIDEGNERAAPPPCAWKPLPAPCSSCAVTRAAHLDCGFRGRNPQPLASGDDFAVAIARSEGELLLDARGRTLALPPHRDVLASQGGVATLYGPGDRVMFWSSHDGRASCEVVPLRGGIESPFVAFDQSIRGWVDGRAVVRATDGAWSIAADDPDGSTLSATAPHALRSGLDARVWAVQEPRASTFRLLAQRWGFAPIVVTQTEPHLQPVVLSVAPPPHGAGPRAPVVVLRDGVRLVAGDNGSVLRRTAVLSLHVPDPARGYREVAVPVGDQDHDCERDYEQRESHPKTADSDYTRDARLVRTSDDALWMLTVRHHVDCTYVLDEDHGGGEADEARHPPPPRMWRGVPSSARDAVEIFALEEDGSSSRSQRIAVSDPLDAGTRDAGVSTLEVAASGTSVLAVVGGLGLWLDMSRVRR